MKKTLLFFLFAISINVQAQKAAFVTNTKELTKVHQSGTNEGITYSVQPFKAKAGTWGYDILANGKVYFHQAEMPGKEGGLGFVTEADALKVGKRIVELLKRPVSIPSLTTGDMQRMGIR